MNIAGFPLLLCRSSYKFQYFRPSEALFDDKSRTNFFFSFVGKYSFNKYNKTMKLGMSLDCIPFWRAAISLNCSIPTYHRGKKSDTSCQYQDLHATPFTYRNKINQSFTFLPGEKTAIYFINYRLSLILFYIEYSAIPARNKTNHSDIVSLIYLWYLML